MSFFEEAFEAAGNGLVSAGEGMMEAGIDVWKACADSVLRYCTQDPTGMGTVWTNVTRLYDVFLGIGASLVSLYFVIGFLNESIDIRNNFTLENTFRFFIRFALAASALTNALSLIQSFMRISALLAGEVGLTVTTNYSANDIFDPIVDGAEGAEMLGVGFLCLIGGLIGMMVIAVSGVLIILSVLTRFFKIFMCIPFAPPALASFAGGQGLSQSGISWIKAFAGYCLETVVIALALMLAFSFFASGNQFFNVERDGFSGVVLGILNICMPMITAVACVKGAEGILRKTLGL